MSATQRQRQSSVATRLLDAPYRFDFFQAVRVLQLWLKSQGRGDAQAIADHVRFENSTSLSFPPSDIESLRAANESKEEDAPNPQRFYLTPSFMGFLGPNGTLPRHYSERLLSHQLYKRDHGPRAFLDTYSNRAVALLYSAWKKYRIELDHEFKGRDGFLPLLTALGGLGYTSRRERLSFEEQGVYDESLAYYTAALRQRPMSAVYLESVLNEHFGVDIKIEQFVGKWYYLPPENQTQLGQANATLGATALSGDRVWQRDLRIALQIGPLRKKDFEEFLPQQAAARALEQMLKIMVGVTLEFEIQLILHADDVQGCRLHTQHTSGRLGLDTFVVTQKVQQNRHDVRYTMNVM
jgi:type VI secretion system protein ImpH